MNALDRCAGCAEPFCFNCLVEVGGEKYCSGCKMMALKGKTPAIAYRETCANAKTALICAVIGLIICPLILQIAAIALAIDAKNKISTDPRLGGSNIATAAIFLAVIRLLLLGVDFLILSSGPPI